MSTKLPTATDWHDPWYPIEGPEARDLERELSLEIPVGHVLEGSEFEAIGRRRPTDDVVFVVNRRPLQLAVVHLTWSSKPEFDALWPMTRLFASWEQFAQDVMRTDELEY